ncbi:unnamed protein product [Ceutorhynchus assimilis]|uniref:THAP-type domain-containing protein n=1 Tax=Ceutorhynchus assimilis TaxID=467358 RepID=A0A9N9MRI7_9CUCU|nr:unnamed protein product [Ceutorhynchus assimilis]
MGFVCCVPGCKNKSNSGDNGNGIQLHRFPNNQQLFDLWLAAIGRPDLNQKPLENVRACYRVCSVHFAREPDLMDSRRQSNIPNDAVPTLLLSNSVELPATRAETHPNAATKKQLGKQQNGNNSDSISKKQTMTPARARRSPSISEAKTSSDLDIQTKIIVFNIYSNLKKENDDFSENQILERISEMTKINLKVVCEVIQERCNQPRK